MDNTNPSSNHLSNTPSNHLQQSYDPQENPDNKKRAPRLLDREQLSRRPSYRKILDELASESGADNKQDGEINRVVTLETQQQHPQVSQPAVITINNTNPPHQQQILAGPQASNMGGMFHVTTDVMSMLASTLTNSTNNTGIQPTVVTLPQGANSDQFATIMSFNNNQAELQNLSATQVLSNVIQAPRNAVRAAPYYNIHLPPSNQGVMTQGGMSGGNHQTPQQLADVASKKREIRFMKNREAARHCRVKKKEYLKCLEERVQILEGQNKKLIDELKALKEFYMQHKKDYPDHNI